MSRYSDDGDGEDFPGQYDLWHANLQRALKGKRGRQALAELREALMALPEHRLIEGALCTVNSDKRKQPETPSTVIPSYSPGLWANLDLAESVELNAGEGVCAVGAYVWHKKVKAGTDPQEAFDSLPTLLDSESDLWQTAQYGATEAGLTQMLASDFAFRNDEQFSHCTPEQRWSKFIDWIDAELAS